MKKFYRISRDLYRKILNPSEIHLLYYSAEPNVGDLLNTYMIPKITGKRVRKAYTHKLCHLMGIGSILEEGGPGSVIWGSGSINGIGPKRPIVADQIHALRGKRSLALMQKVCGAPFGVPLGDPGLLMPMFYDPEVVADKQVGIVPHHSEKDISKEIARIMPEDYLIVDVALESEAFIRQMKRCKSIISSSLHGLILADAYEIPNKWISISDRLIGGDWKFTDYYSMTSTPAEAPYRFECVKTLMDGLSTILQDADVSRYTENREDLLEAFPGVFKR